MLGGERSAAAASRHAPPSPQLPLPLPHAGGVQPQGEPHDRLQPRHGFRTNRLPVSSTIKPAVRSASIIIYGVSVKFAIGRACFLGQQGALWLV